MKNDLVTLAQLARLKEEAARANSAYDAARKQYKAQQRAKARAQGPANSGASNHLPTLLAG